MNQTSVCPICDSRALQTVSSYVFDKPNTVHAEPGSGNRYLAERLAILFSHICRDSATARFSVDLCQDCGFLFSNPRFTQEEIRAKYNAIAELASERERHTSDPPRRTEERAQRIASLLRREGRNAPQPRKLLDYGGATGLNLIPFTRHATCHVMDYVRHDHYPLGVEHIGQDVHDLGPEAKYDLVLLCHALEHVPNPLALVSSLAEHIAVDGRLYVEVPLGALREWNELVEPLTHVNFFSEQSLFNCISRAGLTVTYLSSDYQWFTHRRIWCINLIAQKRSQATERPVHTIAVKTTRQQMNNKIMYLPMILDRARRAVGS